MNYKIVELKQKTIVGLSIITGNTDPQMEEKIGGVWEEMYTSGVSLNVANKLNDYGIGIYSDYEGDKYCFTAGNEVSKITDNKLVVKEIPAGKYAKFSIHGHLQTVVSETWQKIWSMDLDRSFTGDFEEYLNNDLENCDVNIYIALK